MGLLLLLKNTINWFYPWNKTHLKRKPIWPSSCLLNNWVPWSLPSLVPIVCLCGLGLSLWRMNRWIDGWITDNYRPLRRQTVPVHMGWPCKRTVVVHHQRHTLQSNRHRLNSRRPSDCLRDGGLRRSRRHRNHHQYHHSLWSWPIIVIRGVSWRICQSKAKERFMAN